MTRERWEKKWGRREEERVGEVEESSYLYLIFLPLSSHPLCVSRERSEQVVNSPQVLIAKS